MLLSMQVMLNGVTGQIILSLDWDSSGISEPIDTSPVFDVF